MSESSSATPRAARSKKTHDLPIPEVLRNIRFNVKFKGKNTSTKSSSTAPIVVYDNQMEEASDNSDTGSIRSNSSVSSLSSVGDFICDQYPDMTMEDVDAAIILYHLIFEAWKKAGVDLELGNARV